MRLGRQSELVICKIVKMKCQNVNGMVCCIPNWVDKEDEKGERGIEDEAR